MKSQVEVPHDPRERALAGAQSYGEAVVLDVAQLVDFVGGLLMLHYNSQLPPDY